MKVRKNEENTKEQRKKKKRKFQGDPKREEIERSQERIFRVFIQCGKME